MAKRITKNNCLINCKCMDESETCAITPTICLCVMIVKTMNYILTSSLGHAL